MLITAKIGLKGLIQLHIMQPVSVVKTFKVHEVITEPLILMLKGKALMNLVAHYFLSLS